MKTQTETQTKHTPGPWAIGMDTDDESAQIISADGQHLATVEQYPLEANAALIAAAPALLEALRELQKAITNAPAIRVGEFSTLVENAIAAAEILPTG